jgi:hypothetical protein
MIQSTESSLCRHGCTVAIILDGVIIMTLLIIVIAPFVEVFSRRLRPPGRCKMTPVSPEQISELSLVLRKNFIGTPLMPRQLSIVGNLSAKIGR